MANVADPRDNNFTVLRLVAASAVIFSHASIVATGRPDALERTIGYNGGWIAVSAFFSISGMLIYRSIMRSRDPWDYLVARFSRIFPGLWVMLLGTAVVLGAFFTSLSVASWVRDPQVARYVVGNAVLYLPDQHLPGVFGSNPFPDAVNGSLWTLRFEFTCYMVVLIGFLLRLYDTKRAFVLLCVGYVLVYSGYLTFSAARGDLHAALFDGSDVDKLHRLSFAFFLGMLMGRFCDRFRPAWWLPAVTAVAAWLTFDTALFPTVLMASIAAAVFWFAFLQASWLVPLRRMQDYSYGVYIYAFLVQQCVADLQPGLPPMTNALVSFGITLPLAALSWHFVEKPALDLKSRLKKGRVAA